MIDHTKHTDIITKLLALRFLRQLNDNVNLCLGRGVDGWQVQSELVLWWPVLNGQGPWHEAAMRLGAEERAWSLRASCAARVSSSLSPESLLDVLSNTPEGAADPTPRLAHLGRALSMLFPGVARRICASVV
ncbi:hypothetical protein PAPYR_13064 [Paratrimastix pyriformis]|uniref:Uncharacterized protein n=1 Tax=Paratrimastix pyriformis TaxID=342808 RepID=A0ABQ8U600_9EUKA|nr:hypothetical protein PAPYR_13064 [Paratrimastix pyriformis]